MINGARVYTPRRGMAIVWSAIIWLNCQIGDLLNKLYFLFLYLITDKECCYLNCLAVFIAETQRLKG